MPEQHNEDFRHIVRIANTDLDGSKPIYHALRKIRGVSFMFSSMVCELAGISQEKRTGNLSEAEIKKIEEVISKPLESGAPEWMLNRRKDYETGASKHSIGNDLKFSVETDIRRMQKIKCYKGVRHQAGLPVRGQKTRSNFRKNKGKGLGVVKRKVAAAAGGAK